MHRKIWYAPNKFEAYGEEEIKAVEECLRDGWLAGFGKRTIRFEERVSEIFGKKQGLHFSSNRLIQELQAIISVNLVHE